MEELFQQFLRLFQDIPGFLDGVIADFGNWVYVILFAIIFVETGLVIMPFLPGDSLLFAVGAMCARGSLDVWIIMISLFIAAVVGDAVNYHIGRYIGPRVFNKQVVAGQKATLFERLLNRQHLDRAHAFFDKYGGKAVIMARFVPVVRTFVPFVAGAGAMKYSKFFFYNVTGAVIWIGLCVGAGYFFGNLDWVQRNFESVMLMVVFISVAPIGIEFVIERRRKKKIAQGQAEAIKPSPELPALATADAPAGVVPAGAVPAAVGAGAGLSGAGVQADAAGKPGA